MITLARLTHNLESRISDSAIHPVLSCPVLSCPFPFPSPPFFEVIKSYYLLFLPSFLPSCLVLSYLVLSILYNFLSSPFLSSLLFSSHFLFCFFCFALFFKSCFVPAGKQKTKGGGKVT